MLSEVCLVVDKSVCGVKFEHSYSLCLLSIGGCYGRDNL